MAREERGKVQEGFFDVPYGISSAALTLGSNSIATTGGIYYGVRVVASAADCIITVYDNASTQTGNYLDYILVDSSSCLVASSIPYTPIVAKNGIQITVSETGAKGVVWFSPKG